jgi:hypothetical protein
MSLLELFLDGEQKGEAVNSGARRRKATNERLTRQRLKWMLEISSMDCEWSNRDGIGPDETVGKLKEALSYRRITRIQLLRDVCPQSVLVSLRGAVVLVKGRG